jgi:ketosteroid isomerase-like protein
MARGLILVVVKRATACLLQDSRAQRAEPISTLHVVRALADQVEEFRREQRDFLEAGERVVVLQLVIGLAKSGHAEFDVPEVQIWTVRRGKIVGLETYVDTAIVLRALQLPPRA